MKYRFLTVFIGLAITACSTPPHKEANVSYTEDRRIRIGDTPGASIPETILNRCEPATDVGPRLKAGKMPGYPGSLVREKIKGVVKFEFEVAENGTVSNIKIVTSDHPAFAQQTRQTVSRWKFDPATLEGKPVAVLCKQRATFDFGYE
jgi:TonB family protein